MIGSDARRRVLAAVLGAMLGLVAVPAGHAQSEFANLPCVDIGATVTESRGGPGVSEEGLRDALYVGLRAKLPRLVVHQACVDTLRLIVVLISPSRDVFYGTADMALLRRAIVVDTGQFVRSEVWRMAYVLHGSPGGAKGQLLELVDEMLTRFAADYQRNGNS